MPPRKPKTANPREQALRLLVRREHSSKQLQQKLALRGSVGPEVQAAIADLTESGMQSDARYAAALVRSKARNGFGPLRIRAELSMAGVSRQDAEDALNSAEIDWEAEATQLHQRKFCRQPIDRQKQYQYLAQRGYTTDQIKAVLQAVASQAEDADPALDAGDTEESAFD